jgi:recombination protein RecR
MGPLDDLIQHLSRLPGIGERTATRLAFHLMRAHPNYRRGLSQSIERLEAIRFCSECFTVTEANPCRICSSPVRNPNTLCVVEKPSDIYSIEKLNRFNGRYHVLHGLLSPLEGVGPSDLKIQPLLDRLVHKTYEEIIFALSPTVEGDATCQYLTRLVGERAVSLSRLASGIAVGSDLEFADTITLGKAFEGRMRVR